MGHMETLSVYWRRLPVEVAGLGPLQALALDLRNFSESMHLELLFACSSRGLAASRYPLGSFEALHPHLMKILSSVKDLVAYLAYLHCHLQLVAEHLITS